MTALRRCRTFSDPVSQVLLVDPTKGTIEGRIQAGWQPDFALSPDGKRLYILSGFPGTLSVVDTQSGSLVGNWPVEDRLAESVNLP